MCVSHGCRRIGGARSRQKSSFCLGAEGTPKACSKLGERLQLSNEEALAQAWARQSCPGWKGSLEEVIDRLGLYSSGALTKETLHTTATKLDSAREKNENVSKGTMGRKADMDNATKTMGR